MIEYWEGDAYPDFVAEGTGDQAAINAAICAVKKAPYDGVGCVVGGDDTATGTVRQFGEAGVVSCISVSVFFGVVICGCIHTCVCVCFSH